jgi:hypothetical protein
LFSGSSLPVAPGIIEYSAGRTTSALVDIGCLVTFIPSFVTRLVLFLVCHLGDG